MLIVFAACMVVCLAAFKIVRSWEQTRFEFAFERLARKQASQVVERFHSYQTAVQFIGNFLEHTVGATRKEFRGFAENVLDTYPGMQAVSWNLRVRDNQRGIYEKAVRNEGIRDFQFKERDTNDKMVRAPTRPEYVIVYYIEPLKGNVAALGFDIASSAKRLKTIEQARDTGKIVITEKINLVQGNTNKPGALILVPIYKHGVAVDTPKARRINLEGFSVGVLRIGPVVEKTLFDDSLELMNVYLYDESAKTGTQLLYHAAGDGQEAEDKKHIEAGLHWTAGFEMGGRQWKIILEPSSAFENSQRSLQPWIVLAGMLLVTAFILLSLQKSFEHTRNLEQEIFERRQIEHDLQNYRDTLEVVVKERTSNLQDVNTKLEKEINERKQTGWMLQRSEARIRAVVDNLVDGIITINEMGLIETFNPAAESIFSYQAAEVHGKNIKMLMPQPYHGQHDSYLDDYKTTGNAKIIGIGREVSGRRKDGSIFPMELSVNVMQVGKDRKFTGIIRDITERKMAENALQQAKEAAEFANRVKSEFLANMSHEIRTPMNAVLGFTELLNSQIVDKKHKNYLESVRIAGRGLLTLINDILDLSKIEAGQLEMQYEFINLQTIIYEIKQVFTLNVAEKDLEFVVEMDKGLPQALLLDEVRLRQILFNLVGNAVKFTDQGYILLSARFIVKNANERGDLFISVKDTGLGIAEDQQSLIFESFHQQNGQSNRQYGGTGLGLTITRRLVEMMNGGITLKSSEGNGSIFTIILRDLEFSSNKIAISNQQTVADMSRIAFDHARIMVVDDIAANRELVKESLCHSEVEVIEVEDGKTALIIAEEESPKLIFMDIRMPGMDGYETTRRLKENASTKNIPVIALTASITMEEKSQIQQADFDGCLFKPVTQNDLVSQLMRFLSYTEGPETSDYGPDPRRSVQKNHRIERLSEFLRRINEDMLPVWQALEGPMEMDAIEDFADKLVALAREHKAIRLDAYAEELLESAASFDIGRIQELLKQFKNLIDEFKKEQNINDDPE